MMSLLGTDLTDFALSVWVLDQPDASVKSYTLIWFFEAIPGVLLGLFIGSFVDRWNKKKMIIYGQLVAGIGSVTLMVLHYFELLLPWHIMLVAGIGSVASMFVFRAFFVSTRVLVPKEKLIKAQGLSGSLYGVIEIGVPIAAPVLYKLVGIGTVFFVDAVTFIVSVFAFLILNFVTVPQSNEKLNFLNDLKLVVGFLRERKGFINLIIFSFLGGFSLGLIEVLFTPLILDLSNEYILGLVLSFVASGSLMGSIIIGSRESFTRPIRSIVSTFIIAGIICITFFIGINPYILAVEAMLIVLLFTIEEIMAEAFIQTIVPVEIQGRLIGFFELIIGGAAPVAFFISGFMVELLSELYEEYNPKLIHHLPGTTTSAAIITIFVIAGILMTISSTVFRGSKSVKSLDMLYNVELKGK